MNIKRIDRNIKIRYICFFSGVLIAIVFNLTIPADAALVTGNQPMNPGLWDTNVTRIKNLQVRYTEAMNLYPGQLCGAASNSGSAPCVYQGNSYDPATQCPPSGFFRWVGSYVHGDFITCVKE